MAFKYFCLQCFSNDTAQLCEDKLLYNSFMRAFQLSHDVFLTSLFRYLTIEFPSNLTRKLSFRFVVVGVILVKTVVEIYFIIVEPLVKHA